ncbi:AAA family ATPase [Phenylobacterium sp.]|uniref:AAA family ATPase n=1 Tax=Phenylobacterium sp. TaxID=1871053 RepID=UPI002F93F6B0
MLHQPNFFAVTGGPGAGKTTLLRHLQGLGEIVVEESARAILQAHGVRPDQARLAELMLERDLAAYRAARGRTFFDRSLVDAWAMLRARGPCPAADEAVRTCRYHRLAFIAPPWREIYVQDAQRIQTWAEAVETYERCAEAYQAAGYELVELPRVSVEDRAEFVLDRAR